MKRVLVGLGSLIALVALLVGLPAVLLALGPNPFAGLSGDLSTMLLTPDDGRIVLAVIKCLGWLVWAALLVSAITEFAHQISQRGRRAAPAKSLPGMKLPQGFVRPLVGAVLALFFTVPTIVSSPAQAAPLAPSDATILTTTVSSSTATSTAGGESSTQVATPATSKTPATTATMYTVKQGDSLWSIADKELGDPMRWSEIAELNRDVIKKDTDFLRAGWELQLPAASAAVSTPTGGSVTVQDGDTLSGLAERHLGDAAAWPAIYEASASIVQPGGYRITNPHVISTGWTIQLPASTGVVKPPTKKTAVAPVAPATKHTTTPSTTSTPKTSSVAPSASPTASAPATATTSPTTATSEGTAGKASDIATSTSAPASIAPAVPVAPATPAQQIPSAQPTTQASATPNAADNNVAAASLDTPDTSDNGWVAYAAGGIGALLAAGVITHIARRRRNQQRLRRPGQRIPMPTDTAAQTEAILRATGDPLAKEHVDTALRTIAATCRDLGKPLPEVRAARLTEDQFDLYCTNPVDYLPAPWRPAQENTVWTLYRDAIDQLDHEAVADEVAPYPALATIGHDDEDGHLMLNLECLGNFGVRGDADCAKDILSALALELATSSWADDLQVTLVGAYSQLEDIFQTGRLRYVPTATLVLENLNNRAAHDQAELARTGTPTLQQARVAGTAPDAWTPEIVLIAGSTTPGQRAEIEKLVEQTPRMAMATVTTGENTIGPWYLNINNPEEATLEPAGLTIRPQRITPQNYEDLLMMASLSDEEELDYAPYVETTTSDAVVHDITAETPDVDDQAQTAVDVDATTAAPDPILVEVIDTQNTAPDTETIAPEPSPAADNIDVEPIDETPAVVEAEPVDAIITPIAPPAQVREHPHVTMLGPVNLEAARGDVEQGKRARLLEFLAFLALNPGAPRDAIDDAIWPNRRDVDNLNTRNTATSKLRRWLGQDDSSNDYLPRHQVGEGYRLHNSVTNDIAAWDELMGGNPLIVSSANLREGLAMVSGIPFEGHHPRRYAWAEPTKQRLISEIVDAAWELAKREMHAGRWQQCDQACAVGLRIEPAQEHLWRIRILAARAAGNPAEEQEAIDRLLAITDGLEVDLQPETNRLLQALQQQDPDVEFLMATAL